MTTDQISGTAAAVPNTLLNHVGITVSDLEASYRFYSEVLGMQFYRRLEDSTGDWYDTLTENSGAHCASVMLRCDDFVLQLLEYKSGGLSESFTGHSRVGNAHLCINCPDVDAKWAEIDALGTYRLTPVVDVPAAGARSAGLRAFYVRDPDGIPVEFFQRPTS